MGKKQESTKSSKTWPKIFKKSSKKSSEKGTENQKKYIKESAEESDDNEEWEKGLEEELEKGEEEEIVMESLSVFQERKRKIQESQTVKPRKCKKNLWCMYVISETDLNSFGTVCVTLRVLPGCFLLLHH